MSFLFLRGVGIANHPNDKEIREVRLSQSPRTIHNEMVTSLQYGYGTSLIYNTRDQSIIEWTQIGRKYWGEMPSRPAEEVLLEVEEKLENPEWVPYYDLEDGHAESPLFQRKLVENPIVFQNIWPGGIRIPHGITVAIEYMESEHGGADGLRRTINRSRTMHVYYVDSGWSTNAWDPDAFWGKRVAWIREEHVIKDERPHWAYDPQYRKHPMALDWDTRHFEFLKQSAGDRAV